MSDNREKRKEVFERLQIISSSLQREDFSYPAQMINLSDEKYQSFGTVSPNEDKHINWLLANTAETMANLSEDKKPLVLIFGSAHKPGGGILSGARAQEEDISLHSTFYFQVKDNDEFYKMKHNNYLYSDNALYTKNSLVLTDINNNELQEYKKLSFITVASPNLSAFKQNDKQINEDLLYDVYERRLRGILNFAEKEGHKEIVLGPWGCGVFGLDPERTATIFNKLLKENIYTGEIVFSILDEKMFNIYKKNIFPANNQFNKISSMR